MSNTRGTKSSRTKVSTSSLEAPSNGLDDDYRDSEPVSLAEELADEAASGQDETDDRYEKIKQGTPTSPACSRCRCPS
ncbi:MAG: hypothetical protein R3C10_19395 [Pirellulales bacterium]